MRIGLAAIAEESQSRIRASRSSFLAEGLREGSGFGGTIGCVGNAEDGGTTGLFARFLLWSGLFFTVVVGVVVVVVLEAVVGFSRVTLNLRAIIPGERAGMTLWRMRSWPRNRHKLL